MKLYGTLPSPFTRKVRVVLLENKIDFVWEPITQLMSLGPAHFAGNPLHMFPVLEDRGRWLIESDVICRYLLEEYGGGSRSPLWLDPTNNINNLNILSIASGIMNAGVHILRARRSGIENLSQYPFFQQEFSAISLGLEWLEKNTWVIENKNDFNSLDYFSLNIVVAMEWLKFREFVPDFLAYPNLDCFAKTRASHPALAATQPQ